MKSGDIVSRKRGDRQYAQEKFSELCQLVALKIHTDGRIREVLVEIHDFKLWAVLGYKSMRQCILKEFEKSRVHLYRELKAGRIEKVVTHGLPLGQIPERQLREIGKLQESRWQEAWEEALNSAPQKGMTAKHVKEVVARLKASERKETREESPAIEVEAKKVNNCSLPTGNTTTDFELGNWVEVQRDGAWYGLRGAISRIEKFEITIHVDDGSNRCLRFYPEELVKAAPPNKDVNLEVITHPSYSVGDVVWIDTRWDAPSELKAHNGCWGVVTTIGASGGTFEVNVRGKKIWYMSGDMQGTKDLGEALRDVCERVAMLYNREDLDRSEKAVLETFVDNLQFTERQLHLLSHVWSLYYTEAGDPDNIRARVAEHFVPKRDRHNQ